MLVQQTTSDSADFARNLGIVDCTAAAFACAAKHPLGGLLLKGSCFYTSTESLHKV